MKAIVVNRFEQDYSGLEVKEVPMPSPKRGEVLIEVEVGSLSPSDDLMMRNLYLEKRRPPYVAGQMGVGTVVESGGGLMGWLNRGQRVFFAPGPERSGTWAEYSVADAMTVAPVGELSPQDAIGVANSLTAVGLFDTAKLLGAKALIMNAAAGSLGRYANAYAAQHNFPLIGIVRSEQQVQMLKSLGAKYTLNQKEAGFQKQLAELANRLGATVAIDSVAGGAPRELMHLMPAKSTVLSVGSLSGQDVALNSIKDMMPKAQSFGVFVVTQWLERRSLLGKFSAIRAARKLATSLGEQNSVRRTVSLEETVADMRSLVSNTTGGVVLVSPSQESRTSTALQNKEAKRLDSILV